MYSIVFNNLIFKINRIDEVELKTSLSSFTSDSKQEMNELASLCEGALEWLTVMEATLSSKDPSHTSGSLVKEVDTFRPKLAHLRQRSEEIFVGGITAKRTEFEPTLENIYDRWYALIRDVDKINASLDKNTTDTPLSCKIEPDVHISGCTNLTSFEDPDEVIDTLPEDEGSMFISQSSPLKRHLPVSPIAALTQKQVLSEIPVSSNTSTKRVRLPEKTKPSSESSNLGAITYSLANELNNRPPSPPITTSYDHNVLLSSTTRGRDYRPKSKTVGSYQNKKGQYPKPKWYVNSKELHQVRRTNELTVQCQNTSNAADSNVSGVSPERVKVTVNVLPSPQKTAVPSVTTEIKTLELQTQQPKPESSIVPLASSSSSSSPTTSTPSVCGDKTNPVQRTGSSVIQEFPTLGQGDLDQKNIETDAEKSIALEHKSVDKLLTEMDADLAEVIYKGHYLQKHGRGRVLADKACNKRGQEVKVYSNAIDSLLDKISLAKESISGMNKERDLALKRDLIDMELRLLEAEVGTLLSRGSALTLMLQHGDDEQDLCNDVKERSNVLKEAWSEVRRQAEFEKSKVLNAKDLINFYRKTFNDIQDWITRNENVAKLDIKKIANKRKLFHNLECLAERLRKDNIFGEYENAYARIAAKWQGIERKCDNYKHDNSKSQHNNECDINMEAATRSQNTKPSNDEVEPNISSNVQPEPSSPSKKLSTSINLATRIEKLRNAIKAINRQLGTQILCGKELENLKLQKETLDTVKEALDKLKSMVQIAETDIESLFSSDGSMSVEFLEKLTGLNEKLQEEWKWVNNRYNERQSLWNKSTEIMQNFEQKQEGLSLYLTNEVLCQHDEINPESIETARTKIAYHVMDCQEIKSKLSTQEASKGN